MNRRIRRGIARRGILKAFRRHWYALPPEVRAYEGPTMLAGVDALDQAPE
jgi:hypothetical protein